MENTSIDNEIGSESLTDKPTSMKHIAANIRVMKCPSCSAPVPLDESADAVVCEYCGTKVFVDDEVFKYHRILKAESEAKERDAKAKFELEKEKNSYEMRRKTMLFFGKKPVECAAVILCTIWFISKLVSGKIGLIHFLIEAGVIIWAVGAERQLVAVRNIGAYFRNNRSQRIVFVICLVLLAACFADIFGGGMFLVALCGIVWSIRSGQNREMFSDGIKESEFVYVRASGEEYVNRSCADVVEELRVCGFTDINMIEKKDLKKGWFNKVGDVVSVSINGKRTFAAGQRFLKDAKVIVEYHVFQ